MKSKPNKQKQTAQQGEIHPSGLSLIDEFLRESNAIEREYTEEAFEDAKKAWEYAETLEVITSPAVKEIHRILMQRLRPDIAGEWRDCDVYIGGHRKIFVSQQLIESDVDDVCFSMLYSINQKEDEGLSEKDKVKLDELKCKGAHIAFENVHPFEDGNGRVGRIIWQWHRLQMGLPVKVIHEGEEQMEYYKWFSNN